MERKQKENKKGGKNLEEKKERDIIELIYQAEEKVLDEKIKQANKKVKDKIKDINLEEILGETANQKKISKMLDQIEENYSIKITQYNKEFYRQGFVDGIHLMINCLKA